MKEYHVKLMTDVRLSSHQQYVWNRLVDSLLDGYDIEVDNMIDDMAEMPYEYYIYTSMKIPIDKMEKIVDLWGQIYPKDFQIETSSEYDDEFDIDIDNDVLQHIQHAANKFFHNRWVEDQIDGGWRYGLELNRGDLTDPRLRNWDSLAEPYRTNLDLTPQQVMCFIKNQGPWL